MSLEEFHTYLNGKLAGGRQTRSSWMMHWLDLANFILPRRYRWLISANAASRGSPINSNIIDSTGTLAARTLASGMMAGITSPTRPWFKLKIEGYEDDNEVAAWLAECQKRLMAAFQASNFYSAMATMYFDLVVFGSACVIIYEDFDDIIHCFNPCLGEFYFELDDKFEVTCVMREMTMTQYQMILMFGENNVSEEVKRASPGPGKDGGAGSQEKTIGHIIERNKGFGVVSNNFKWREAYWEIGGPNNKLLRAKGFHDWPCMTPRWDVQSNDPYGRSPGMDALGDVKQLQQENRRKAQAIDKMVNPPLVADVQLKNQPMSLLPGGVTYVNGLVSGREGAKPLYTLMPPIAEMMQDIREVQQRIKITFHNDLFTGITDLQTVRTATEIDARREEKLVLLGPVLERILDEGLGNAIDRTWGIMWRGRLLPIPPQSVQGLPTHIQVDYVSMLAMAQRGLATASIEKLWAFAGNIAAVRPAILDGLDEDASLEEYAEALGAPPRTLRSEETIKEIRDRATQEKAMAEAAAVGQVATEGAKTLSETEVGGGINALQLALGNTGV